MRKHRARPAIARPAIEGVTRESFPG